MDTKCLILIFVLQCQVIKPSSAIEMHAHPEVIMQNGTTGTLLCTFKSSEVVSQSTSVTWSFQSSQPDNQFFKTPYVIFYFSNGKAFPGQDKFKDRLQFIGDIQKRDVSIQLSPVQFSDIGTFFCDVKNPPDVTGNPAQTKLSVVPKESINEMSIINIYNRLGQDAILPCVASTCSIVTWLYNRNQSQYFTEVVNGNVLKNSARAARLSVNTDCSLVITNITTEDVGYYTCRQGKTTNLDKLVFLSVLTISPSPADADPKRDNEVTLECSLSRHSDVIPCQQNSIRWINETGAELLGEGVGYKVIRQTDCVSVLTVKRQSGINRRYTCQFVVENKVEIEIDYTPDFTVPTDDQTSIIIGAVVGAVAVLVVIAAVVIRYRKRAEVTENVQRQSQHPVEPESNLTYVTVNHANQKASPHIQVKEEEVTYSAIKY